MFKILELRPYMLEENDLLFEMLQEIPKLDVFNQTNEFNGLSKDEAKELIIKKMKIEYGIGLTRNVLPSITFVLYDNEYPVCIGGLRIKLNKYWTVHSGNLWFKTRPSERGKGYGTIFCELMIKRAKELGFDRVIGQCNENNLGSKKIFEKNHFTVYRNPYANYYGTVYFEKDI